MKIISHGGFTEGKAKIKTVELVLAALLLPLTYDHSATQVMVKRTTITGIVF